MVTNSKIFLNKVRDFISEIDKEMDGIELKADLKNKISGPLFDIAHEHAKAIVVLLENNLYASAYALGRPLFETSVRAAWIQYCASEHQINDLVNNDIFTLKLGDMLKAVEEKRGWKRTLSQLISKNLKTMHSYTHGGLQLVSRRLKDDCIEQDINDLELVGLLQVAAMISFLSFTSIVEICGSKEKNKILNDLLEDLSNWCFKDLG